MSTPTLASVSGCHHQSNRISLEWSLESNISISCSYLLGYFTLGVHVADGGGGICTEIEMYVSVGPSSEPED